MSKKKKGLPKRMKRPSKKAPSWSEMSPSEKKMFRDLVAIDKFLYGDKLDMADKIVKDVSKKEKVRVSGGEPPLPKKRAPKKKIEKKATPKPKRKAVRRSAKAMSSTKRVQK
jgi:hypothetical protein|tara:strand:- start:130 stop:465 length:336 start_codon:yes stop_codon:yes gene_type:complete